MTTSSHIRWKRVIPLACAVIAAIGLLIWGLVAARPAIVGWLDVTIATQEAKGMQPLLVGNVFVNLLFTGLILWFVYFCTDAFDFKKRGELYWLYVTLTVLVLFFIFEFTGPFLTPRLVVSATRQTQNL